jgi:7,8-dihydropterin-6-yl-methyl-4-(beta-D-ribofuranosyl)aminobenzene 5'-phosphate synthase
VHAGHDTAAAAGPGMFAAMIARSLALGLVLALAGCRPTPPTATAPTADLAFVPAAPPQRPPVAAGGRVQALTITVLSTMLADRGIGEWGFAALVEADGRKILFDTGARPDTVLQNAAELGVDLHTITDVVLSHHHDDHVGGLMTLRDAVQARAPQALATVHVGRGMFDRRRIDAREVNSMLAIGPAFEATGGHFVVHDRPAELAPGVWVTGPVPRTHPERNWSGSRRVLHGSAWVEDTLAEDQSLVLDTDRGLVVLSGCGHAGIVNTIDHARATIRAAPIHAAIGGFHLLDATDEQLEWTGSRLAAVGLESFFGGHCTGMEAVYRFRALLGLPRSRSLVAAVGGRFELGAGISPGALAH